MRIIDRDHDCISIDLNLDRTAFWMTIHGATREHNRVLPLSVQEMKELGHMLLCHAEALDRKINQTEAQWPLRRHAMKYATTAARPR